ncbi:hypothetical protein PC9H_008877 [Pleurotus ostreatus]|uniref:Uncharacterized protein n=1 Tax=Pleurotus ostreatus TaxID=5322 RepID=A0A8H6ZPS8_PLEOS|nr:uncharacterized protein PC9H_008877 [Pleurotus ostreatus]KAF7426508.1 hypothetical protein PC9H_008877 [Pleurotus ostreatus]
MPKVNNANAYFSERDIAQRLRQFAGGQDKFLPRTWRGVSVQQIGNVLKKAYKNLMTADRLSKATHIQHAKLLEDVNIGLVTKPTVLVSSDYKPLIVYLPHVVAKHIERNATEATFGIEDILAKGVKKSGKKNWRNEQARFKPYQRLPVGQEAFSGGWFAQGHASGKTPPRPSVSLRSASNEKATEQWLKDTTTLNLTMNLIMGAVHPDSYNAGAQALRNLRQEMKPEDAKWACLWASVATAVAIVSNGTSPPHFDSKGDVKQFDALTNLGSDYVRLGFPDLGGSFHYHGGSVVLFSGKLFKHEVKDWVVGERVGYAYFMRAEVQKQFRKRPVDWARIPKSVPLPSKSKT